MLADRQTDRQTHRRTRWSHLHQCRASGEGLLISASALTVNRQTHWSPLPLIRSRLNSALVISGIIGCCLVDPKVRSGLLVEVRMWPRRPYETDRRLVKVGCTRDVHWLKLFHSHVCNHTDSPACCHSCTLPQTSVRSYLAIGRVAVLSPLVAARMRSSPAWIPPKWPYKP